MQPKTKRRLKICTVVLLTIVIILPILLVYGGKYIIGQHQRSVIIELKEWETQYSTIGSTKDAIRSIDMYEYITRYYVAGEGYYSSRKRSLELEGQRAKTLDSIVKALENYTGLQYGHDYAKWEQWKNEREKEIEIGQ